MTTTAVSLPRRFASLVKLEHTVFALPFAYVGVLLALGESPSAARLALGDGRDGRRPDAGDEPESADRRRDRRPQPAHGEPRAAGRDARLAARCSRSARARSRVFLVAVFQLDPVVRWLWPIPVVFFVVYPYLKRVTWLCHLWLGASLGLAPVGAWVAVTGELPWEAWALGGAVALWVAGFDLFYSLFDLEHDREQGLHSWATRFGERGVFAGARVAARRDRRVARRWPGSGLDVGLFYWLGVGAVAALLAYEHSLVRPGDLRRLDAAFFTVNGVISIVFLGFVLADVLL